MAQTDSAVLDDPIIGDGDVSFLGGQVSAHPATDIPKGAYAEGRNIDFDPFGRLVARRGAKSTLGNIESRTWDSITDTWNGDTKYWGTNLAAGVAVDGCAYFKTYATDYAIVAQGGVLKQGTESGAFANIASSSYSGSYIYFAQLNNRLYYCDGAGALKYVDSTAAHNAITAGKVTSIKITSAGQGYTSVPDITFSGGAATATAVLGYGGRVVGATITAAGSGYSATTPPTISFSAAPAAGTTATGRVNISQVPSKPTYITAHTNRLFCATADTTLPQDVLYASDFLDGESWDLVGASVRIGGDGDPITALYPWINNNLLVFKQRSVWSVNADPLIDPASWVIKLLSNRVGCVAHRTVQAVGADVFFMAQDGVRSISQIESGAVADIGLPISSPIQDQFDAIAKDQFAKCSAIYYKNRYLLNTPNSAGAITGVLVWNNISKSWLGKWTGWQPRDFCLTGFSGRVRMNFADDGGMFWTYDDFTRLSSETSDLYLDDTVPYESYVITRAYTCGEPLVDKKGHTVQLATENLMTNQALTAYVSYDIDLSGSFTSIDAALSVAANDRQKRRTYNLLPYAKFNAIQFKFGAPCCRLALASVALTAFADNIKPELSS